jgi:predicted phosphodiesterase
MGTDVRRLLVARPDYLLSGHSHYPADRRDGPTRRINPGALHRADEYTVALLGLESDELRFLTVPR